jgi:hypothetical protein
MFKVGKLYRFTCNVNVDAWQKSVFDQDEFVICTRKIETCYFQILTRRGINAKIHQLWGKWFKEVET